MQVLPGCWIYLFNSYVVRFHDVPTSVLFFHGECERRIDDGDGFRPVLHGLDVMRNPDNSDADSEPVCEYGHFFFEAGERALASDLPDREGQLRNADRQQ